MAHIGNGTIDFQLLPRHKAGPVNTEILDQRLIHLTCELHFDLVFSFATETTNPILQSVPVRFGEWG